MKYIVLISRILLGLIFVSFRPEWFSALYSDSRISGRRGTVHRSHFHITFLHRRFSDSDRQWPALGRKQIRPVGAASSRPGDRQHSSLPHFHVHTQSPTGTSSHCALVDCVLAGAQRLLWCVCREGSVGGQTRLWGTESSALRFGIYADAIATLNG